MKKEGKILRWDAARGFGFIRSAGTSADIFFHVKDFRGAATPQEGMPVSFDEIQVGGKGPRAVMVQLTPALLLTAKTSPAIPAGVRPSMQRRTTTNATAHATTRRSNPGTRHQPAPPARAGLFFFLMLAWALLIAWASWVCRLPAMTLPLALLLSLVTFFVYWLDKHAAQTGQWRTSENTLHLFSLLGGWPGAWCAQQALRHKSSKASFLFTYWATVALHCGLLAMALFNQRLQGLLQNI